MTVAVAFCVVVQISFTSVFPNLLVPCILVSYRCADLCLGRLHIHHLYGRYHAMVRILPLGAQRCQQGQHRLPCTPEESRYLLQTRVPRNYNSAARCATMDQPPVHLHQEGIIHTYTQPLCPLTETTQAILGRQEDFRCICGTIS